MHCRVRESRTTTKGQHTRRIVTSRFPVWLANSSTDANAPIFVPSAGGSSASGPRSAKQGLPSSSHSNRIRCEKDISRQRGENKTRVCMLRSRCRMVEFRTCSVRGNNAPLLKLSASVTSVITGHLPSNLTFKQYAVGCSMICRNISLLGILQRSGSSPHSPGGVFPTTSEHLSMTRRF